MKNVYLTITVILLLVTQVWCKDEPPKCAKAKREVYNYNYPANYECQNPPACLHISSIPNQNLDVALDAWVGLNTLFYITMSACWGYKLFANILLGRKVFSPRELEEMCLTSYFGYNTEFTTYSGYGNQVYLDCNGIESSFSYNCTFLGGDPGTDVSLEGREINCPVLSDGMSWIVYYRCVDNHYRDFQLYTTRSYVEKSLVTQVMAMAVNQLRFSANEIKLLPCYFPTYPVPLQNYPEPDSAVSKSCRYNSYSPIPQLLPTETNNPPHYNSHPNHPNPY